MADQRARAVAAVVGGVVVAIAAILTGGAVQAAAVARASDAAHTVATIVGGPAAADTSPRFVLVPATWEVPAGGSRVGSVAVPPGTPVGRTVDLWVDGEGLPVAPLGLGAARTAGLLAGLTVLLGGAALVGAGGLVLARRTCRGIDREWAEYEQRWNPEPRPDFEP